MTKTALITGVSGQDGYCLSRELLDASMDVVGTTRDKAAAMTSLGPELASRIRLVEWDLSSSNGLAAILEEYRPSHVYNLAAFSSGEFMDRHPELMADTNGVAVLRMLEAIKRVDGSIRFCQASSSEVFAASGVSPQNETTPRVPRSIYGAAKIFADNVVKFYREKHGLFASSAILFNHESPRRGDGFVTQKIVQAAARISLGKQDKLALGNLSSARDWGYAGDYMRAMRLMLEANSAGDYVLATGTAHTVAELCELAFGSLALDYRDYVEIDPQHYRAAEPAPIIGDASRAKTELGWTPVISFEKMIGMMIEHAMHAQS